MRPTNTATPNSVAAGAAVAVGAGATPSRDGSRGAASPRRGRFPVRLTRLYQAMTKPLPSARRRLTQGRKAVSDSEVDPLSTEVRDGIQGNPSSRSGRRREHADAHPNRSQAPRRTPPASRGDTNSDPDGPRLTATFPACPRRRPHPPGPPPFWADSHEPPTRTNPDAARALRRGRARERGPAGSRAGDLPPLLARRAAVQEVDPGRPPADRTRRGDRDGRDLDVQAGGGRGARARRARAARLDRRALYRVHDRRRAGLVRRRLHRHLAGRALPAAHAPPALLARAEALARRARPAPPRRRDRPPHRGRAGDRELRALRSGRRAVGPASHRLLLRGPDLPRLAPGARGARGHAALPLRGASLLGADQARVAREAAPLRLAQRRGRGEPRQPDAGAGVESPGRGARRASSARTRGSSRPSSPPPASAGCSRRSST